ncbi:sodium-coupled neutral amino acid transporter 9 homolog isoform X1 [Cydia strobilella]|uniref:sodium-coupled neutral amino acid transporter 9 homolog isoform X1 n=2 Tax=Cydia strobilella TaxID=1100964 RepID=UPI0030047448
MVKFNARRNVRHDSQSSGNSASEDHFELFGSGGSDLSEDENFFDDRQQSYTYASGSSVSLETGNFRETMARVEAEPLLGTAQPPYKSIATHSPDPTNTLYEYKKKIDNSINVDSKKQSSLVTIFSVWNTVMGSSLLTMAWGVERAGLPAALVLVALMAALCLYTAYVLLRVNKHHGTVTCEVPALCLSLLGPWAARVAHGFSLLVLLGANVVYWILITNFFYFTVNYLADLSSPNATYPTALLCPKQGGVNGSLLIPEPHDSSYWGLHTTVPFYVALLVFPLLNFSNVSFFTKFNSLGTLSVVYLLIFVIVKGWGWGINVAPTPEELPATTDAAVLSGMLALSFYIHNIIITIMSNNERQEKNGRDLTIAFVLVTMTYLLVGAVFYICFPLAKSCIEDNILNNFEMHDTMTAVARALLLFQVITVYPLVAYMLRSEALLLLPISNVNKSRTRYTVAINVVIVSMCVAVACLCPNIGTIIRYTGAISGLVHVFALPSILQVRSLQLRGKLTCWKLLLYFLIVVFGIVNLVMQFFIKE